MESILKCATLHKSFTPFVPLRSEGFAEDGKDTPTLGEVMEIIKVTAATLFA